jgi:hypothetical protein
VRTRVVSVTVGQSLVGLPHHGLEFEEFAEERGTAVVDLAGSGGDCQVGKR